MGSFCGQRSHFNPWKIRVHQNWVRSRASKICPYGLVSRMLWKIWQRIVRGRKGRVPAPAELPAIVPESTSEARLLLESNLGIAHGDGVQSSKESQTVWHSLFSGVGFWPHHVVHFGILVPQPGIEPLPLQWKPKVLATGLPRKAWIWCIDAWDWNKEGGHQYLSPTYHLKRNIHSLRKALQGWWGWCKPGLDSALTGVVWLGLFSELLQKTWVVKP